jgi:hypothetical protein
MGVASVYIWMPNVFLHLEIADPKGKLGCNEGDSGIDLGAQNVPKWGSEFADSNPD